MPLDEVMNALEAAGTEQNRRVYARHGVSPPMFGVSRAALDRLRKAIKVDHDLALDLWATGNHDARVLATKVVDPERLTARQADAWVRDCADHVITDELAKPVAASPAGHGRAGAWRDRTGEWVASAGWVVTALLAMRPGGLTDGECEWLLAQIERDVHDRPNRVRHEMNGALIAIGLRGGNLEDHALEVAERVGPVVVDHGRTGCKTPAAVPYIRKATARRQGAAQGS